MDLAKIIGELRQELQCLDAAIISMEELARAQNLPDSGAREKFLTETEQGLEEPPPSKRQRGRPPKSAGSSTGASPEPVAEPQPVKRLRGRPRKNDSTGSEETPQPADSGSAGSNDDSTSSIA